MIVSGRIEKAANKIFDFVNNETSRHVEDLLTDYRVFLKFNTCNSIPVVDVTITNVKRPRVFSSACYSLYYFQPLIRNYANSRTLSLIERASEEIIGSGIPCTARVV